MFLGHIPHLMQRINKNDYRSFETMISTHFRDEFIKLASLTCRCQTVVVLENQTEVSSKIIVQSDDIMGDGAEGFRRAASARDIVIKEEG